VDTCGWRKSRFSGASENCVEVAPTADGVLVRDTKDHGNGPVISFTAAAWADFLRDVREGNPSATIETQPAGTSLHSAGTTLRFTLAEWNAFRAGVLDGDFELATLEITSR
jgi:hypothetical protein